MKTRLFVDMDGTLAVFRKYITNLEALCEPGYFRSLPPNINVVEAIKEIIVNHSDKIEVFACSAYLTDSKYALDEKNAWLDEFLPEIDKAHRVMIPCGENKADYIPGGVRETDTLFDDLTKNLTQFKDAGGKTIKLWNGINGTNGTYQGDCVSYLSSPEQLANKLLQTILQKRAVRDKRPQDIPSGLSEQRAYQMYYNAIRNECLLETVRLSNILFVDFEKVVSEPLQERDFELLNITHDGGGEGQGSLRTIDMRCRIRDEMQTLSYTFDADGNVFSQNISDDVYLLMSPKINRTVAENVYEFAKKQKEKDLESGLEERE